MAWGMGPAAFCVFWISGCFSTIGWRGRGLFKVFLWKHPELQSQVSIDLAFLKRGCRIHIYNFSFSGSNPCHCVPVSTPYPHLPPALCFAHPSRDGVFENGWHSFIEKTEEAEFSLGSLPTPTVTHCLTESRLCRPLSQFARMESDWYLSRDPGLVASTRWQVGCWAGKLRGTHTDPLDLPSACQGKHTMATASTGNFIYTGFIYFI